VVVLFAQVLLPRSYCFDDILDEVIWDGTKESAESNTDTFLEEECIGRHSLFEIMLC